MKGPVRKTAPRRQPARDTEPVQPTELEAVRRQDEQAVVPRTEGNRNIFIGTLNVFAGPMRAFVDPVRKVCYPALTAHWDQKYRQPFAHHAWKVLLFDLVLLFLASFLAVTLVLVYRLLPPTVPSMPVSVSLHEPKTITSGQPIDLTVAYANRTSHQLNAARMTIELPDGFLPLNDAMDDGRTSDFALGDLPAGSSGRVTVSGRAYGSPGDSLPVLVRLSYWENGLAGTADQTAFYQIPIDDSPFRLEFEFEQPFLHDTVNTVRLTYANVGPDTISGAAVRLNLPPEFSPTGSSPRFSSPLTWRIGSLAPGETGELTAYGRLARGGTPSFSALALTDGPNGQPDLTLNMVRGNPNAEETGFMLSQDVHGLSSLRPGETLTVTVEYANRGHRPIRDISIDLSAGQDFLAADSVPNANWTVSSEPKLGELLPGQAGKIEARFRIKDRIAPAELDSSGTASVRLTATAEYKLDDSPARTFRTDSATIDLPISTALSLDVSSLYYTETHDQLGTGPLPPTVGQPTRYWIGIAAGNGIGQVDEAQLTAVLAPGVTWTGRTNVTAGEPLIHVTESRRVIWRLGDMPAFAGELEQRPGAGFEVEYTPTEENVGTAPVLVERIFMAGTDSLTGTKVETESGPVTTAVRFGTEDERLGLVR
ncbi:MAG: hypothetical protein ABIJ46_05195 [bacterium]